MNQHQRKLIRYAVCEVLRADSRLLRVLQGRVFASRYDHYFAEEYPAVGVYTDSEAPADELTAADRRVLELRVEVVQKSGPGLDDFVDDASLLVEEALRLDAIGAAIKGYGGEDTLESLAYQGMQMEIGANEREDMFGVLSLDFLLTYTMPERPAELDDFLQAHTLWNLAEGRPGQIQAESIVNFPAPEPGKPQGGM